MAYSGITGNEVVTGALGSMVRSGKVPHAILLHEDDGGEAMKVAHAFLSHLFCRNAGDEACHNCPSCNKIAKHIHPDVHYVFPVNNGTSLDYLSEWRALLSGNESFTEAELQEALGIEGKTAMIKVDESKRLLDVLGLSALEGGYRAVVVYLPEKMNREAANRLLKAIEEPPVKTQFVLISHSPESVLPTIYSRCQRIRIAPAERSSSAGQDALYEGICTALLEALAAHDLGAALAESDEAAALPSREKMRSFCASLSERLRGIFLCQQGLDGLAAQVPQADRALAGRLPRKFPRAALDAVSRADDLIGRNVAPKIIFTDLCDRLYISSK
ncbi:MAG: hypothetical protein KBS55_03135 [Bacteroidales bacterium]|nr:hypothetical protein [Candidatus Cryptobacteroides aphodequi]